MHEIPEIVEVRAAGDCRVWVRFAGGEQGEVDLSSYTGYGPIFAPLADESFFRQVRVLGGTIAWPNGADIAPERLLERLIGSPAEIAAPTALVAEGN